MPYSTAYFRPTTLDEAAGLLAKNQHLPLAGGTTLVPRVRLRIGRDVALVDLQSLGLDSIEAGADTIIIGAMVRLSDLASSELAPALVREAAQKELPSALGNQSTVGGRLADTNAESILVASLLACGASVSQHGRSDLSLADYLEGDRDGLVVSITLSTRGQGALVSTGRTPADVPIVAALSNTRDGLTTLALTGVASTPILVDPDSPTNDLNPPADFRGSTKYRKHLAATLGLRAVKASRNGL